MAKQWLFDRAWTKDFTSARQAFLEELLRDVGVQLQLKSAIDVGCGVGDFSKFLFDLGFRVLGVDGRKENAEEAGKRYSAIEFLSKDAEELEAGRLGTFDLVLCFGLLYHVENPFRVIRKLFSLTEKMLIIEGICVPSPHPTMHLFDESVAEDQGLNYIAFYPSESCLVKMMYKAGFPFVYSFTRLPQDALYSETVWRKRVRAMLVGSRERIEASQLVLRTEPHYLPPNTADPFSYAKWNPWSTALSRCYHHCRATLLWLRAFAGRASRPLRKVWLQSKAANGQRS